MNQTLLEASIPAGCVTHFDLQANLQIYNRMFAGGDYLDVVILGVGEDGHVASIFPGDEGPVVARDHYLSIDDSPKPPPRRITLGKRALLDSGHVYLLFIGAAKRAALERFLDPSVSSLDCPARLVLEKGENVTLVSDLVP